MPIRIVVPSAAQTTEEMTLLAWRVSVGQVVARGDILAELETDKAIMELESYAEGRVLKLMAEEGEVVTVGQTIGWVGDGAEPDDAELPQQTEAKDESGTLAVAPTREATIATPVTEAPGRILATPAARTLAREKGVDLSKITGSGPDGSVVRADVESALSQMSALPSTSLRGQTVPLSKMRRALSSRLTQSKLTAPHFYVAMEVNMAEALDVRAQVNVVHPRVEVSINDLVIKAAANTLTLFPRLNCRLEDNAIHYLEDINVGIAVGLEDGLAVPVLAHADTLNLLQVAEQTKALIALARQGKAVIGPAGTFTVSNLGMYGVKFFTAIINPPEAAILAVGSIEQKLAMTGTGVTAIPTMILTLSADHRIVDGAVAAQFLAALRDLLESRTKLESFL